ncbi:alpha/beta fold hydrolase [Vitiosangium sp. GDMCC 1.1324]|uniref:alpha/beta fold hydrolase n=1 Tax=Vitiosangium sp. (strain GDMCC 1.1324) TaxID=2138576 RepID=UPI000D362A7B|nr:alpha/beta hydrolase [Vitiosangium sp. GDMCC 1.1324]PTL83953.1 alpha/beta hydrolase [Vitiosangium sp. GDMCC 1.1324]
MSRLLVSLLTLTLLAGCATTSSAPGTATASAAPAPFHVERTGHGRPMLLIPGLSSSGEVWNETVAHYRDQYDCHVFTLAGFAGQPPVSTPFLPTMRRALADYIREQHLEKPILVGHSLGGVLALAVAEDAPELVGAIVIVDSLPFLPAAMDPSATPDSIRPQVEQMGTLMRMQSAAQRNQQTLMTLRSFISDEKNVQVAMRWSIDSDPETIIRAYADLSTTDLRPELSRITAPTLVLGSWVALKGRVAREQVEAVYRGQYSRLSGARVTLSDTARHFIMWDDPAGFLRETDAFLATVPASVAQVEPRR